MPCLPGRCCPKYNVQHAAALCKKGKACVLLIKFREIIKIIKVDKKLNICITSRVDQKENFIEKKKYYSSSRNKISANFHFLNKFNSKKINCTYLFSEN